MCGFARENRWLIGGLAAVLLGFLGIASPALAAEEKDGPKGPVPGKECPNVVVITNVDVHISTWLKVQPPVREGEASKPAQPAAQPKAEPEKAAGRAAPTGLAEVLAALGKLLTVRDNVVVMTNVKVKVDSWLDLVGPLKKPAAKPEPEPKPKSKPGLGPRR